MTLSSGKAARLNRLFNPNDGRAVCVAADHGWMSDPTPNVLELKRILEQVVLGGADGVLVSFGTALRMSNFFQGKNSPALLLRADWMNMPRLGGSNVSNLLPAVNFKKKATSAARDALLLGASGITIYYFIGYSDEFEAINIEQAAFFAKECRRIGLPLIIEPMAVGGIVTGVNETDILIAAGRIAAEIGADVLKIPYTNDVNTFKKLIDEAGVPVLVLGGAKSDDPRDALELVDEALRSGASGTVFGRNVTKARDPRKMVSDICSLVHSEKSIDEILGTHARKRGRLRPVAVKCTGCQICEIVCAHYHSSEYGQQTHRLRIEYRRRPDEPHVPKPIVCPLCEKCVEACREGALKVGDGGYLVLDKKLCNACGDCVSACPLDLVELDADGIPIFCDLCEGNPQCILWCKRHAIVLTELKGSREHVS
jgi:DhnA family fructose-bisphosphate aldolase class Ia/Fe-S-cluster-containing hydrogenase component 2